MLYLESSGIVNTQTILCFKGSCLPQCPEGFNMEEFVNDVKKKQILEPWSVGRILYFKIVFDDF